MNWLTSGSIIPAIPHPSGSLGFHLQAPYHSPSIPCLLQVSLSDGAYPSLGDVSVVMASPSPLTILTYLSAGNFNIMSYERAFHSSLELRLCPLPTLYPCSCDFALTLHV